MSRMSLSNMDLPFNFAFTLSAQWTSKNKSIVWKLGFIKSSWLYWTDCLPEWLKDFCLRKLITKSYNIFLMLHTSILHLATHILDMILITVNQFSYVFQIEINYEEYKDLLEVLRKALLWIWHFELNYTQYEDESWIRIYCGFQTWRFSCENSETYWRYQELLSWKLKHLIHSRRI